MAVAYIDVLDIDGLDLGICQIVGKATLVNGEWRALANVNGGLAVVILKVTPINNRICTDEPDKACQCSACRIYFSGKG